MESGWNVYEYGCGQQEVDVHGIYGCGCKEVYRFPHNIISYLPLLLLYLFFFAIASLLFVHFLNVFLYIQLHIFTFLHCCSGICSEVSWFSFSTETQNCWYVMT